MSYTVEEFPIGNKLATGKEEILAARKNKLLIYEHC
jgi:hypothetical protein